MELRTLLGRIGASYNRELGIHGEAQDLLREAPTVLLDMLPAGLVPDASGGKGNAAVIPWIAVFNPDETETAQQGMYVVYLFDATMKTVALSLNQGVTELVNRFGTREGRRVLARQAAAIRDALPDGEDAGLEADIDLQSSQALPRNYESGNIVARTYDLGALPPEAELQQDLQRFVQLYELARDVRTRLRMSTPDAVVTTTAFTSPPSIGEFKPKSDAEYVQQVAAKTLKKRRDHERVVKQYGLYLQSRGFTPNTNVHPRDLTVTRFGYEWLVEVKVVYRSNGVQATRDALSQLLMYRDVWYSQEDSVRLLAVFSEDVGEYCRGFLEKFGIASVWKDSSRWSGSPSAVRAGLAEA